MRNTLTVEHPKTGTRSLWNGGSMYLYPRLLGIVAVMGTDCKVATYRQAGLLFLGNLSIKSQPNGDLL